MDGDKTIPGHEPADILVTNWDCGTSAAFDITVASLLNSINMLEVGKHQGVWAKAAEHRKWSQVCWVGLAMYTIGSGELWSLVNRGIEAFSQVATRLAIHDNTPKSKVVAGLYGRLSLLLVRANTWSILVHSYPQTPQQENELFT